MNNDENKRKFPQIKRLSLDPPTGKLSKATQGTEIRRVIVVLPHPPLRAEEGQPTVTPDPFYRYNLHWYKELDGRNLPLKTHGFAPESKTLFNPPKDNVLLQSINILFGEGMKKADIGRNLYPNPKIAYQVIPLVQDTTGKYVPDIEALTHTIPDTDETILRPLLLEVGNQIHKSIMLQAKEKADCIGLTLDSIVALSQPDPLAFTIKGVKTGPEDMNIEYSAAARDFFPLPEEIKTVMDNRYNLSRMYQQSSIEDQVRVLRITKLPDGRPFPIPSEFEAGQAIAPQTGEIPVPNFNTTVPDTTPNEEVESLQTQLTNTSVPY